jgi:peptidoglycan lytic transglycosylase G
MLRLVAKIARWLLFCTVLMASVLAVGYWYLNDYLDAPLLEAIERKEAARKETDIEAIEPLIKTSRIIVVSRGTNLTTLSTQLATQGILKWPKLFVAYARLTGQTGIRVGEYQLKRGDTPRKLLDLLMAGKVIQYQLTIPEGLRFREWLPLLAGQSKLIQQLKGLSNNELLQQLGLDIEHPEGWFFPDTYLYSAGDSDRDILIWAHTRMREILDEEWKERSAGLPYSSPYEALILASIVEKETGVGSEREEIAGVFVRRLNKGMRLQTDPTVIYGLGDQYQGNITRRHLKQPTAYNTYMMKGLPPTPIAMPGREAIHAALHPLEGKTLYFVAKGDGSHYFSATLDEHLKAVRRYQLKRRSNYRSSPEG